MSSLATVPVEVLEFLDIRTTHELTLRHVLGLVTAWFAIIPTFLAPGINFGLLWAVIYINTCKSI